MSEDARIMRLLSALAPHHDVRVWAFIGGGGVGLSVSGVEWRGGQTMLVSKFGRGETLSDALQDYWMKATDGSPLLILNARDKDRRKEARWNGVAWEFSS